MSKVTASYVKELGHWRTEEVDLFDLAESESRSEDLVEGFSNASLPPPIVLLPETGSVKNPFHIGDALSSVE